MNKTQQFCKNHEQQIGSFFLADQPWVKYCSQCALNMALCGKKIDKVLSQQQYDNKTQILSIIQRIKSSIERIEPSKKIIDEIVMNIDNITKSQFAKVITNFDGYVRSLCQIRDQITQVFQSNFPSTMQSYFQKQTKMLLYQIELKQNLEYIQGNYRSIIQNKCDSSITEKIDKWNNTLINVQRLLPIEKQAQQINQLLQQTKSLIQHKLLTIQPFKFNPFQQNKKKYETKATQHMLTIDQTTAQQGKQNVNKTKLKLRSKSKHQTQKKLERESIKMRKSIRDISNFQIMESFRI